MEPFVEPITIDALPNELHVELSNYLSDGDLQAIRTVSHRWNETAKYKLRRRRGKRTFTFDTVAKLAQFNATFANFEPMEDFASAKFCFKLRVLASEDASELLDTFAETFGAVVTRLILNFQPYGVLAIAPEFKVAVDRHLTGLLSKVKGQLQKLVLLGYRGLDISVLGPDPFPALRVLKIQTHIPGEALEEDAPGQATVDPRQRSMEAFGGPRPVQATAEGDPAPAISAGAADEAFVLAFSQKVPAIEQFSFGIYTLSNGGDPAFLSTVLRNLVRVNPNVSVKLALNQSFRTVPPGFLEELVTVPVKVTDLCLLIDTSDKTDEFRKIMKWISAHSDCLKTLTFYDAGELTHRADFQFPRMRVLEELTYFPLAGTSLLPRDSAAQFPNLRFVRTVLYGHDAIVPLPTVTELVLLNVPPFFPPMQPPEDIEQLLELAPFPNLTSLRCSDIMCLFASLFKLRKLTRLHFTPHPFTGLFGNCFWDCTMQGAPRKLTYDEIMALPEENAESEGVGARFRRLENLTELVVTLTRGHQGEANGQLDTLVYLSKTKRLQRLSKLVIDIGCAQTFFEEAFDVLRGAPVSNSAAQVPDNYLQELGRYHDSVCVKNGEL